MNHLKNFIRFVVTTIAFGVISVFLSIYTFVMIGSTPTELIQSTQTKFWVLICLSILTMSIGAYLAKDKKPLSMESILSGVILGIALFTVLIAVLIEQFVTA